MENDCEDGEKVGQVVDKRLGKRSTSDLVIKTKKDHIPTHDDGHAGQKEELKSRLIESKFNLESISS